MGEYKLWTRDIVFEDNNIFFSAEQFNGLFKYNLTSGKAEFIDCFPEEPDIQFGLHSVAIRYKDEILFLPDLSCYITLYDLKENKFRLIKFPVMEENSVMQYIPKIIGGILVDSYAYAFGGRYPIIIRYDFKTGQIKVYNDWLEQFKLYGYKENTSFFCPDICHIGNSIYVKTLHNNVIVDFNLKTEKVTFHESEYKMAGVLCGKDLKEFDRLGEALKGIENNYVCCADIANEIWLFPHFSEPILILDKRSGKFKTMDLFSIGESKEYRNNKSLPVVWFRKVYGDKLYFMSVLENKLYCFRDSEHEEFCIDVVDTTKRKLDLLQGEILREEKENSLWGVSYSLEDLLNMVLLRENNIKEKERTLSGAQIYNFLIEDKEEGS